MPVNICTWCSSQAEGRQNKLSLPFCYNAIMHYYFISLIFIWNIESILLYFKRDRSEISNWLWHFFLLKIKLRAPSRIRRLALRRSLIIDLFENFASAKWVQNLRNFVSEFSQISGSFNFRKKLVGRLGGGQIISTFILHRRMNIFLTL